MFLNSNLHMNNKGEYQTINNTIIILRKNGCFAIGLAKLFLNCRKHLQFNFWITKDTYNSVYLYIVNVNGQVAWVAKVQLSQNNLILTIM
jgi:hypothetical protein